MRSPFCRAVIVVYATFGLMMVGQWYVSEPKQAVADTPAKPAARPHFDKDTICVECVDPRNHLTDYVTVEEKKLPHGYLFTCPGGTRGFLAEKVWRDAFVRVLEVLEATGSRFERVVFINHTDCQYCKKEKVTDEQNRAEIREVAYWFEEYNQQRFKKKQRPLVVLELWKHDMETNAVKPILKIKIW